MERGKRRNQGITASRCSVHDLTALMFFQAFQVIGKDKQDKWILCGSPLIGSISWQKDFPKKCLKPQLGEWCHQPQWSCRSCKLQTRAPSRMLDALPTCQKNATHPLHGVPTGVRRNSKGGFWSLGSMGVSDFPVCCLLFVTPINALVIS